MHNLSPIFILQFDIALSRLFHAHYGGIPFRTLEAWVGRFQISVWDCSLSNLIRFTWVNLKNVSFELDFPKSFSDLVLLAYLTCWCPVTSFSWLVWIDKIYYKNLDPMVWWQSLVVRRGIIWHHNFLLANIISTKSNGLD